MFDSIRGRLASKEPASCVVEAGGIGYAVSVPLSTYEKLPAAGAEVTLRLHLIVREDEWRLVGFTTDEERRLFRACLRVSGVGPVTALAVLSGMAPADLRAAVVHRDVASLSRVKGIGKKTAERLVVELKDSLDGLGESGAGRPSGGPSDAVSALIRLGLDRDEAERRLSRLPGGDALPLSERVRRALRGG